MSEGMDPDEIMDRSTLPLIASLSIHLQRKRNFWLEYEFLQMASEEPIVEQHLQYSWKVLVFFSLAELDMTQGSQ